MIAATDSVVREDTALASCLDDETIMIDIVSGKYLTIDPVGTSIWQLIQSPISVDALVDALADRYEAPREQIRRDVLAFLNVLETRGFARVVQA